MVQHVVSVISTPDGRHCVTTHQVEPLKNAWMTTDPNATATAIGAVLQAADPDDGVVYTANRRFHAFRCLWCGELIYQAGASHEDDKRASLEHFKTCAEYPDKLIAAVLRSRHSRRSAATRKLKGRADDLAPKPLPPIVLIPPPSIPSTGTPPPPLPQTWCGTTESGEIMEVGP